MMVKHRYLLDLVALVIILLGFQGLAAAKYPQSKCQKTGKQCNGCQEIYNCVERDGLFVLDRRVEMCPGAQVCDSSKDVATCDDNAVCRYKAFECPPTLQETIFPDPFSCAEYHICTSGKSLNFVCPHEKPIFDPKLKLCVKSSAQGKDCRQPPVPVCNRKGDKGILEGTAYAYECVEDTSPYRILYPKLSLIIVQGMVFSDEALESSDMPPPSTTATKPPTSPTSSAPATKQSTALPSTPMGGSTMEQSSTLPSQQPSSSLPPTLSTSPGLSTTPKPSPCTNGSGAYAVPNDCRKYLLCYVSPDGSIQHKEKECRDGSHFDSGAQRCIAGSCTSFPTTVSSPLTEVTTAVPIACKADGILPDKDCCRCYYVCYTVGSTLDYVHRCCRSGSHFDTGLKRCVAGPTCTPVDKCP